MGSHNIYKKREVPWHFENYWTHGETTNDDMFINSYPLQSWSGNRWSDFRNVGCLEGNRPRTGWAIHSGTMTSQPCAVSQSFCLESLFSMLLSVCNFISWDTGPRKKKINHQAIIRHIYPFPWPSTPVFEFLHSLSQSLVAESQSPRVWPTPDAMIRLDF